VSDKKQVLHRITCTELHRADQLYLWVTIDTLPNNILLDAFEFYLGKDNPDRIFDNNHNYDGWQQAPNQPTGQVTPNPSSVAYKFL